MRAVQLALLVMCIQVGLGLVAESGAFSGVYFENKLLGVNLPSNISATSEAEQVSASVNIMNSVWNILTWGWIKNYFEPWYSQDAAVKSFVDSLVLFLAAVSGLIIGAGVIEFVRNRINVLSGG